MIFFLMMRLPPRSTLFPSTTLFRSSYFRQKYSDVTPLPEARLNTESPAWAVDRLSILALKIYHMREQARSEEHTSELQSRQYLVCRLLLEKKKLQNINGRLLV